MLHNKKSLILILTFICIVLGVVSYAFVDQSVHLSDEVNIQSIAPIESTLQSNRYTQTDDLSVVDENPYVTLESHSYLGTYQNLSLYINYTTLSIRILNHDTNFIWGSNMNLDYLDESHPLYDENNPGTNIQQDTSPVSISYYNTNFPTLTKTTEYFFDGALSGTFVLENLIGQVGFKARMKMPRSGITFDLYVYLDDEGLNVVIPFTSIKDNNQFMISTITVYRNFAITPRDLIPGYVFIPDGVGALIRYSDSYNQNFSKKFYGSDPSIEDWSLEYSLSAAVYGSIQGINQNGVLVILKSGAGNATLTYTSHSQNVLFNKLYVTYEYREKYLQRLNASGTNTIEQLQTLLNPFDIHTIYKFVSNEKANYVGFATEYRNYLINQGYRINTLNASSDISLHLDVMAAANKPTRYGRETFKMTSVSDLTNIVNDLFNSGIKTIRATVHGWNQYGYLRTSPNFDKVESKFGNPSDLQDVNNLYVYYSVTPTYGFNDLRGYSTSDISLSRSKELNQDGDYYLLRVQTALDLLKSNYQKAKQSGINNLSFEWLTVLYSDYTDGILSRDQTIEIIKSFLEVDEYSMAEDPFDYLFNASVIKDISMYSSNRLSFTDTVPFLTLVLSGQKEVYARSSNFFANTQNELLRMIDYQLYPNFYVTEESAQLLIKTDANFIFTSKYTDWKTEIIRQYNYVNDALKHVIGNSIIKREVIHNGVIKNTYDNNVVIYINYSGNPYTYDNITIDAMSYEVIR